MEEFFSVLKKLSQRPHEEVVCEILNQFDEQQMRIVFGDEAIREWSPRIDRSLKDLREEYPKQFARFMSMTRGELSKDQFLKKEKYCTEEVSERIAKKFEADPKKMAFEIGLFAGSLCENEAMRG